MAHLRKHLAAYFLCLIGLLMMFHPTLLSGFRLMQTDVGDTVLVHFILEHSYRWLTGASHLGYWDPAVFHPVQGTLAYSEILLGGAPLYWMLRALPLIQPDTAFQLWMLALSMLNFAFCYVWLRSCFNTRSLPAALGAFLFAFAGSRAAQVGHQQLLPQFYSILAIYAATRALEPTNTKARRWIFVFAFSAVGQLYASIYAGWFFAMGTALVTLWALILKEPRARLFAAIRKHPRTLAAALAAACLFVSPMALRYLATARQFGLRQWSEISWQVPPIQAWFYLGPGSWLYSWMPKVKIWRVISVEWELRIGLGFVTTALAVMGLLRNRRKYVAVTLLLLATATMLLTLTKFPPNSFTFWKFLYPVIPGAGAIRAIGRAGLMLLIPASVGVALYFNERLEVPKKTGVYATLFLALLVCLEQGRSTASYDKFVARQNIENIVAAIDPVQCGYFYYSPVIESITPDPRWVEHQLNAIWAQLRSGVPTLNGYSGNEPPGWNPLERPQIQSQRDQKRLEQALKAWSKAHALDETRFCWVKLPVAAL